MAAATDPASYDALAKRRDAARLTWRGPALMLFARTACAVGTQALVATVFALRASPAPFMVFRAFSPLPFSIFAALLYLRLRRLVPFVIAHAFMDGASVLIGVLLPVLRG